MQLEFSRSWRSYGDLSAVPVEGFTKAVIFWDCPEQAPIGLTKLRLSCADILRKYCLDFLSRRSQVACAEGQW